jgi:hypothetical protein
MRCGAQTPGLSHGDEAPCAGVRDWPSVWCDPLRIPLIPLIPLIPRILQGLRTCTLVEADVFRHAPALQHCHMTAYDVVLETGLRSLKEGASRAVIR